jgi:FixJ family two-component response regulator
MGPWSNFALARKLFQSPNMLVPAAPLVAIVDDEEPVRKALGRLLQAAGFHVQTFASGQVFLEAVAVRSPDCLVLDLHMPGLTGLQVLQQLQSSGPAVPTIVITAHDEPQARSRCVAAGAVAFLPKPLDGQILLQAISQAVAR